MSNQPTQWDQINPFNEVKSTHSVGSNQPTQWGQINPLSQWGQINPFSGVKSTHSVSGVKSTHSVGSNQPTQLDQINPFNEVKSTHTVGSNQPTQWGQINPFSGVIINRGSEELTRNNRQHVSYKISFQTKLACRVSYKSLHVFSIKSRVGLCWSYNTWRKLSLARKSLT